MKKIAAIVLVLFSISGCTGTTVYQYSDRSRLPVEIGLIRPSEAKSAWTTSIASYKRIGFGGGRESKRYSTAFSAYPRALKVLPGTYVIGFHCTTGSRYAYPAARLTVSAGEVYEARCFNAVDNKVGIEVKRVEEESGLPGS